MGKRHGRLLRYVCPASGQEEEAAQCTQKDVTLKVGPRALAKGLVLAGTLLTLL